MMPRKWAVPDRKPRGEEGLTEFITKVDAVLLQFGTKHSWALTGPESEYVRPHVVRKIALAAVMERKILWWGQLTTEAMHLASADREHILQEIPPHWMPKDIAHEFGSPPFLLSMWLCLFKPLKLKTDAAYKEWLLSVDVTTWNAVVQAFQKENGQMTPNPLQVVEFALKQAQA